MLMYANVHRVQQTTAFCHPVTLGHGHGTAALNGDNHQCGGAINRLSCSSVSLRTPQQRLIYVCTQRWHSPVSRSRTTHCSHDSRMAHDSNARHFTVTIREDQNQDPQGNQSRACSSSIPRSLTQFHHYHLTLRCFRIQYSGSHADETETDAIYHLEYIPCRFLCYRAPSTLSNDSIPLGGYGYGYLLIYTTEVFRMISPPITTVSYQLNLDLLSSGGSSLPTHLLQYLLEENKTHSHEREEAR